MSILYIFLFGISTYEVLRYRSNSKVYPWEVAVYIHRDSKKHPRDQLSAYDEYALGVGINGILWNAWSLVTESLIYSVLLGSFSNRFFTDIFFLLLSAST